MAPLTSDVHPEPDPETNGISANCAGGTTSRWCNEKSFASFSSLVVLREKDPVDCEGYGTQHGTRHCNPDPAAFARIAGLMSWGWVPTLAQRRTTMHPPSCPCPQHPRSSLNAGELEVRTWSDQRRAFMRGQQGTFRWGLWL